MNVCEQIEESIKLLKTARYSDDKKRIYDNIARRVYSYLKTTNTNRFNNSLILSFFPSGYFPKTTENRHRKNIINTLKEKGVIIDDEQTKTAIQRRVYELRSDDKHSYMDLMKSNGYTRTNFYKWVQDKDGIPRRKKVGTSNINGLPRDKNGDICDDYDEAENVQTISRSRQGVFSFGNKSIAYEKRPYSVKCYRVV